MGYCTCSSTWSTQRTTSARSMRSLSTGGLLVGVVLAAILLVTVTRTPATSGCREPLPELLIDTSDTNEKQGLQSKRN